MRREKCSLHGELKLEMISQAVRPIVPDGVLVAAQLVCTLTTLHSLRDCLSVDLLVCHTPVDWTDLTDSVYLVNGRFKIGCKFVYSLTGSRTWAFDTKLVIMNNIERRCSYFVVFFTRSVAHQRRAYGNSPIGTYDSWLWKRASLI